MAQEKKTWEILKNEAHQTSVRLLRPMNQVDVVVIGGGNAALCAALAAHEGGASVIVLERAPKEESGGNSRFTAGSIRFAYAGMEDLREVVPDLSQDDIEITDFGTYTENYGRESVCTCPHLAVRWGIG